MRTWITHYLPHQSVVVVRFNLAGIDQFSLERSEARAFGDAAFVREDPAVRHVSPGRLQDGQPWNSEPEKNVSFTTLELQEIRHNFGIIKLGGRAFWKFKCLLVQWESVRVGN